MMALNPLHFPTAMTELLHNRKPNLRLQLTRRHDTQDLQQAFKPLCARCTALTYKARRAWNYDWCPLDALVPCHAKTMYKLNSTKQRL